MRIITEAALDQCVSLTDIIAAVEKAFHLQEEGSFSIPNSLRFGEDDEFSLIPCFKQDMFATKLVTVYPRNLEVGKPVSMANVLLNDAMTGQALALINGIYLTALGTGAVSAVSAKYLSPAGTDSLGIIGAGWQGLFQALAICAVRPIGELYLYDADPAACRRFTSRFNAKRPDIRCETLTSSRDVAEKSQIICCATTSAEPVLPEDEALFTGRHIIGVGSCQPHTAELAAAAVDAALAESGCLFVDSLQAMKQSGDLAIPLAAGRLKRRQVLPLSKVVKRGLLDERLARATTLFKSVGLALFDLTAAAEVYKQAEAQDFGLTVNM